MANPVDIIITNEALSQLKELNSLLKISQQELLKLGQNALQASKSVSSVSTPSGLNSSVSNNASNNANIQAQATSVKNLSNAKIELNKRSAEEIVNNGILNRNAKQQVLINSQLAGAYANLSAKHAQASRTLQDLIVRGKLSTQTTREYNRELRNAQKEFNTLHTRILTADKAVGRFNRNVGNYPQIAMGFRELLGAFGIGTGITIIASLTKDIFEQTKQLQSLDLALKQVIGTQDDFVQSQTFLLSISDKYGVGIKELTKSYTQFYVSAKDKLARNEIQDIFESISKAAGAMGLSVEQQQGAFLALTQMLSKGNVQAEELRGQLSERLPGAFGIMAKSMGVTEMQLNKLLKDGKVMAAEVLPAFAKELEKAYGIENLKRVESLNAATTRLSNAWTNLIRSMNEGGGAFSKFLQTGINNMTILLSLTERLLTSSDKLRQNELNSLKSKGYNNASEVLNQFSNINEKEAYAQESLIKTRAEIAKNTAEFDKLNKQNRELTSNSPKNSKEAFERRDEILNNKKIVEANKERIKYLNELIYKQVGYVEGLKAILKEEKKIVNLEEETEEARNERLKKYEEAQKTRHNLKLSDLNLELQVIERTLNNEEAFYVDRLKASELYWLKRLEIINESYKEEVRLSKGNKDLERIALNKYHSDTLNEIDAYNKRRKDLEGQGIKMKTTVEGTVNLNDELKKSAENAVEALKEQDKAEKDRIATLLALQKATEEYISTFSNSFLSEAGLGSFDKFFDGTFSRLMAGADTLQEKFSTMFLAITESAQEAFNFINQASQANFDAEYRRLELQRDVAIQFAGESTVAQERINEEYDRRKKEIRRREAEAQKKMAIFNILINTAQGVVSALASTPPNIPLSIAIGIIGAAQLGIAQAQEIPQFFEGGTHKGGLMLVNDAKGNNYRETIVTPDGKVIQPKQRNVLMDAPSGTQIYTPEQWHEKQLNDMLLSNGIGYKPTINAKFSNSSAKELTREDFNNGIYKLSKAIKNAPSSQVSFDEKGYRKYQTKNGIRTQRLNNRLNINGK